MEILSRILEKARDLSLLKGFHLRYDNPSISHLFYADDVLLFGQASVAETNIVARCLYIFLSWLGQ